MICKLCQQCYVENIDFHSLFKPALFCPACRKRYQTINSFEMIPITDGWIKYYSLYDLEEDNPHIKRLLFRSMKTYFIQWMHENKNDFLIIILDDHEYETFPLWFPLIRKFHSIHFYSLFHFDLSIYPEFLF